MGGGRGVCFLSDPPPLAPPSRPRGVQSQPTLTPCPTTSIHWGGRDNSQSSTPGPVLHQPILLTTYRAMPSERPTVASDRGHPNPLPCGKGAPSTKPPGQLLVRLLSLPTGATKKCITKWIPQSCLIKIFQKSVLSAAT